MSSRILFFEKFKVLHCMKIVGIRSYSGPHFPSFGLSTDQNNSEYGPFLRNTVVHHLILYKTLKIIWVNWVINPGVFEHKMKMMGYLN